MYQVHREEYHDGTAAPLLNSQEEQFASGRTALYHVQTSSLSIQDISVLTLISHTYTFHRFDLCTCSSPLDMSRLPFFHQLPGGWL